MNITQRALELIAWGTIDDLRAFLLTHRKPIYRLEQRAALQQSVAAVALEAIRQAERSQTPAELLTIRLQLGLTQAQLGRELGRHRNTIADWEHGKRPVNPLAARILPLLLTRKEGT